MEFPDWVQVKEKNTIKASFGRYQTLFRFIECEMLLEVWNSLTSSFQCEIKWGIRIAPNLGAIVIGQK